jgi:hypothetical protein
MTDTADGLLDRGPESKSSDSTSPFGVQALSIGFVREPPIHRIGPVKRPNRVGTRGQRDAEFPKLVRAADVVITMGCGDACPIYPGKLYRDWELTDPAGKSLADVRSIRDDIDRRAQELISELTKERTEVAG